MKFKIWCIVVAVFALLASACGGSDDTADGDDGSTSEETTSDGAGDILFESDFSVVCNGAGVNAAKGYTEGEAVTHMVGLAGEAPDYDVRSTMLNEQWRAPFDELNDTQVVVCADRTASVEGELCTGYEDDDISWEVQTFGASYDISVRDAATGDELESTSVDVGPDSCPIFSSYSEGDPSPVPSYATPDDALEALLAPLATGAAAQDAPATTVAEPATETTVDAGSGESVSRDEAIGQLIDIGGYGEAEAECVVDGTIDEYGEFVTDPTPAQQDVLGQLLIDCAAEFGTGGGVGGGDVDLGEGPDTPAPGTDPVLDALWNECAAGDPSSCDSLYFDAPVGSDYEQFGFLCGYRTEETLDCTTLMNG